MNENIHCLRMYSHRYEQKHIIIGKSRRSSENKMRIYLHVCLRVSVCVLVSVSVAGI